LFLELVCFVCNCGGILVICLGCPVINYVVEMWVPSE
jgi:hypothetical protein